MAQVYKTSDGDVVDQIAWRQYGGVDSDILRAVLEANPGLSDMGPVLPSGVRITLPDIQAPASTKKALALWD